jgi:hypothetical protein
MRDKPLMVELTPKECEIDAASHMLAGFIINHPDVLNVKELEWICKHSVDEYKVFSEAIVFISKNMECARTYCEKMLKAIDLYHNEKYL